MTYEYSLPLPPDSPNAGKKRHKVPFDEEFRPTTRWSPCQRRSTGNELTFLCKMSPAPPKWTKERTFLLTVSLDPLKLKAGRRSQLHLPSELGEGSKVKATRAEKRRALSSADTRGQTKLVDVPRLEPPQDKSSIYPEDRTEYESLRNQRPERQEFNRRWIAEKRRRSRELGLCRDCPNPPKPALPGAARCEECAEKHRQYRRKYDKEKRAKAKAEGEATA